MQRKTNHIKSLLVAATVAIFTPCIAFGNDASQPPEKLIVMTWNILGKGNTTAIPVVDGKSRRQLTVEIIKASKADIICMVEQYGSAAAIAEALGFHYYTPAAFTNLAIFSRYPISKGGCLRGMKPFGLCAATVNLPGGHKVRVYDIWLHWRGSEFKDLVRKDLKTKTFTDRDQNRMQYLGAFLKHKDLKKHKDDPNVSVIVAGDFNTISHLDYCEQTKRDGLHAGRVLPMPVSSAMANAGFIDSYRKVHPIVKKGSLGYTWRTDKQVAGESASTIVRHPAYPERFYPAFPSDHGAVVSQFKLNLNPHFAPAATDASKNRRQLSSAYSASFGSGSKPTLYSARHGAGVRSHSDLFAGGVAAEEIMSSQPKHCQTPHPLPALHSSQSDAAPTDAPSRGIKVPIS